ncbi:MAG TPA: hypothetical protein VMN39_13030 [Longimicrobiaceae bacterium]|nr:hypothetical protein [Longimicrobiaceae bacterium]
MPPGIYLADLRYRLGAGPRVGCGPDNDRDFGHRLREGWHSLKREARQFLDRGYDRHFF